MRRSTAAGLCLSAICLSVSAPQTSAAAAVVPAGAQHITTITVVLKAPHPTRLAALARARGLTRSERVRELAALVPDAATHQTVATELRGEGLTVTGSTTWSITATGPAPTIANRFGTRPKAGSHPSAQQLQAATSALPSVPSTLRSAVSAVFPTAAGPMVAHHATTSALDGTDFRNAYTAAGSSASTGQDDAGTTVATVQFADFRDGTASDAATSTEAADLTSYADEHGLIDPVASGQYEAVRVDGGPSTTDDSLAYSGDTEVDLDQESILSTAPTADQHAYFAPNTDAGFADVFASVYDDVTDTGSAGYDPHITALSTSWGECESEAGTDLIDSVEPILASLTAAGVTVFASSGDDGIYDCGATSTGGRTQTTTQADVDFPASSPYVVAVGGTTLTAATSTANTGSNWTETGWSCTSAHACELTDGGSGGGVSQFAAPTYQTATIQDSPFAGANRRLVPDIAADADPNTGFVVYSSNPELVAEERSNDVELGGTSLAAPNSAALFDDALANAGYSAGVGDIHDALYSAYAKTASLGRTNSAKVFRDITAGSNGASSDKGSDPSVSAQSGYDTVSGLGGVLWSALMPYLAATGRPGATGTLALPDSMKSSGTYTISGTWKVTSSADDRAVATTAVTVTAVGGNTVYHASPTAASGSFHFTGKPGRTYQLTVIPTDLAGTTATGTAMLVTPIDDKSFTTSKGWTRVASTSDFGGSHIDGTKKSLSASVSASGRTFTVRVPTGPSRGRLGVYSNGKKIATVDEYANHAGHKLALVLSTSTLATRALQFRPLATKDALSRGIKAGVDSLTVDR